MPRLVGVSAPEYSTTSILRRVSATAPQLHLAPGPVSVLVDCDAGVEQVEDRARSIALQASIIVHRLVVQWNVDILTPSQMDHEPFSVYNSSSTFATSSEEPPALELLTR